LRRQISQEQIEPFDQEAESHDRNRGPDQARKVRSLAAWSL
jgi:hypothetical protein